MPANLRATQLTPEQIVEAVACGRPGHGHALPSATATRTAAASGSRRPICPRARCRPSRPLPAPVRGRGGGRPMSPSGSRPGRPDLRRVPGLLQRDVPGLQPLQAERHKEAAMRPCLALATSPPLSPGAACGCGSPVLAEENDLREFRVGMPVSAAGDRLYKLTCAQSPSARSRAGPTGGPARRRARAARPSGFRYDDSPNERWPRRRGPRAPRSAAIRC